MLFPVPQMLYIYPVHRKKKRMRGLDLPHRRYSMPETIMRKFRLGQSSTSSSENSSRSSTRQRRHVPRRKQSTGKQHKVNRSSQTSPKCQEECLSNGRLLLDSSPSLLNRRASSVPDLSSSENESHCHKFNRPISASEKFFGTPSPSQVSCYGGPGHTCALCSTSWSLTSSDYTLTQTVSDRTTSTQDSTLSVQSTSPSTPTPVPFTAEQALLLENSIFQPSGNFIAVHTESILIHPISVVESSNNWHYGFSPDDLETLAMAPQSIGTITEDDIGAITSGRKDRSTSIGEWPSMNGNVETEEQTCSIGVQADETSQDMASQTVNEGNKKPEMNDEAPLARYSYQNPLSKEELSCERRIGSEFIDAERGHTDNRPHRNQKTQFNSILKNSKSFPPSCYDGKAHPVDAEVAVTGGNYKDLKEVDSVIARYSAVPRSNSMLVNTSSVDYTSDSDLSLTDSLEDSTEINKDWPQNRHDNRLVRGEVSLDQESKNRKRYPKGKDAYAYFLSLTGEQDMIKECPVPDWLSARLKKREEEIKKLFEVKLNKHQTIIYRRRKKLVRHMENYHGTSRPTKNKSTKAIKWEDQRNDVPPTVVGVVQQVPNSLQVSPKKETRKDEPSDSEQLERANSQQSLQTVDNSNKYVHISEVIKIEMSNQLETVITKEKQINLNHDAFLRDGKSIQTSEIINNEDAHNSQRIIMRTNVGNFEIGQNNTMIDLQPPPALVVKQPEVSKIEEVKNEEPTEVEAGTQTVVEHDCSRSLLARQAGRSYSFKQFVPLFQSKADDQTVADILLAAMNEDRDLTPGKVSVLLQTRGSSESEEGVETVESACNTDQPYLSEAIQTSESYLESSTQVEVEVEPPRITMDKSEQCNEASIDYVPTEILQTENKQCNTDAFSVPAIVQTKETFQEDEKSFVEAEKDEETVISLLSKDKGTDAFEEIDSSTADKSCNTANPLTTSSVQTDNLNSVNEVKPLVVQQKSGKKKDVQFDESVRQTKTKKASTFSRQKRDTPTPYCTRANPDGDAQILELNVPPCTCHMCTFHKKKDKDPVSGGKKVPRRPIETAKDKKLSKFPNSRGKLGKFQRKFDAIPEEKGGSTESIPDAEPKDNQGMEWSKTLVTTGTMTKDPGKHVSIQEPPLPEDKVDDTTQTVVQEEVIQKKVIQVNTTKKSNLVIGRFRAVPDESQDGDSSSDLGTFPDGLEVVRQYKGRAALATSSATGQEELLTLSKGWINFYLLKDNHDPDDAHEEGFHLEGTNVDERIQEYTLEIQATPEPGYSPDPRASRGSTILPNLPTREVKRRHKSSQANKPGAGQVTLPDIHSSSSSSTPENQGDHHSSRKHHRRALPDVGEPRTSRHEVKARRERREQVTAVSKTEPIFKLPTEIDHNIEASRSTKAVEVARSEHSVSSITSSTVILSESPSPQQLHFSDRKVQKRSMFAEHNGIAGSSWTVTVAGSSGVTNQTPPDVEMRLSFAKPNGQPAVDNQEYNNVNNVMQYNSHQTHHISRSKRQGKMIEEFKHSMRNERHSLQYVPELRASRKDRGRVESSQKIHNDEDRSSRMSPRSKCSEIFSEEGDLQVTGLAITPELKPRVPTQSERDLVRRQRYKFTR